MLQNEDAAAAPARAGVLCARAVCLCRRERPRDLRFQHPHEPVSKGFFERRPPDIIATDAPGDIILEVKYDARLPEVIRPKGNTSLTSIANDPTTDRYSFKLEFDHYVDGQTCFGLDKLILNNNYADATNMKEALIYDMYQYLGADASLYNYAKLSVNGEYWGVYLALEAVEDSFLLRNYGVQDGELYKPDSMNIGRAGETPAAISRPMIWISVIWISAT